MKDVLFLLRRHRVLLFLLPLLLAVLAMVTCFLMRPVFTSSAVVFLRPNFDRELLIERSFSKLEDGDSLRSIERALIADTVLLRVIDRLDLRDDPSFLGEPSEDGEVLTDFALLKKVRKRFTTKLIPNTRLIELHVKDFEPERSKLIAETLIREFLSYLAEERDLQQEDLRITLVSQADAALEEALASEKKLEEFRSSHPDLIVEQDSSVFQDRLLQYSKVMNEASSERSSLEGMVAALEITDPEEDPYRIFQILKNRNSEYLSKLLEMHANAKAEFASVSQRFTKEHPTYREAASRLEQVESTLRGYAQEMKEGLEAEFLAASRKEEKLSESLNSLQSDFVAFKSKSAEFRGLKEQIDRNWNTYTQLQEKITNIDLNPENEFNFVTVISKPIVPGKKSHPVTKLWMALAGMLGMAVVAGSLLFRYRDGLPFVSKEQVEDVLGSPVLVSIDESPKNGGNSSGGIEGMMNVGIAMGEAKIIHLLSPTREPRLRNWVESFARMYGRHGHSTLLVEVTMTPGPGENRVLSTPHPGVSRIVLSTDHLFDPAHFREGLENSLQRFDRVVVDTSELTHWEGLCAVCGEVERNLIVVRKKQRSRLLYRRFADRCREAGASLHGALVVEGSPAKPKSPKTARPAAARGKSPAWNPDVSLVPGTAITNPTRAPGVG